MNKVANTAAAAVIGLSSAFAFADDAEARSRGNGAGAFIGGAIVGGIAGALLGGARPSYGAPAPYYGGGGGGYGVDRNGNGPGCNQPWRLPNGNVGGTFNACRGERPPAPGGYGFGGGGYEGGGYGGEYRRPRSQSCVVTQYGQQFVVPCQR